MRGQCVKQEIKGMLNWKIWMILLLLAAAVFCLPKPVLASTGGLGVYNVQVDGYLALRNAKAYDASNEIGALYTGQQVLHVETLNDSGDYWYVYSWTEQKLGYVNKNYLVYDGMLEDGIYCDVSVDGYLAIRTAKAYDASNEIGKLYTGDTVLVLNDSDPEYWLIYSPDELEAGYVNRNYLVTAGGNTGNVYTDNSVGGISANLRCDMDNMIFSTSAMSFIIPDSWGKGINYFYYEDRIEFYCSAVYNAPGLEDGYLCTIFRSTDPNAGYEGTTSMGSFGGYYYYFSRPTDLRANPNDAYNYSVYQEMSGDLDSVRTSLVIGG